MITELQKSSIVQVCPNCKGHTTGRISMTHYFCSECCLEFSFDKEGKAVFFYSDPTGTVVKTGSQKEAVS